ncbi:hypothetical protein PO124_33650 [Bacillus licheniformis]|nr:hypothetical protein [Bacillus licheniformis]
MKSAISASVSRQSGAYRYPLSARFRRRVFFQKQHADYAPEFITSIRDDEHEHIICSDYSVLLWLANQLALEFHIPFKRWIRPIRPKSFSILIRLQSRSFRWPSEPRKSCTVYLISSASYLSKAVGK